jgi:hypothetical protein
MPKANDYLLKYRKTGLYFGKYGGDTNGVNNAQAFGEETANTHRNNPSIRPDIVFIKVEENGKLTKLYN